MTKPTAKTEFVFLTVPDDVKPEDASNQQGQDLLKVFQAVKEQEGFVLSGWGRSEEDKNAITWITEWSNNSATMDIEGLKPLALGTPKILKIKTVLEPTLSEVGGLKASACVDVTTLTLKGNRTEEEIVADWACIQRMKKCVTQDVAAEVQPGFYCLSTTDTFPQLDFDKSPTGKADLCVAVVGWTSMQQHLDMWKTDEFKAMIPSVRGRLLPYPQGAGMKHSHFHLI